MLLCQQHNHKTKDAFIFVLVAKHLRIKYKFPLEKGMATHSSILSWRIPWTEDTIHGVEESNMTE